MGDPARSYLPTGPGGPNWSGRPEVAAYLGDVPGRDDLHRMPGVRDIGSKPSEPASASCMTPHGGIIANRVARGPSASMSGSRGRRPEHPFRPVVVSHGTGGSGGDMRWLVEPLVAAGFRVIAVDHHGNN